MKGLLFILFMSIILFGVFLILKDALKLKITILSLGTSYKIPIKNLVKKEVKLPTQNNPLIKFGLTF